MQIFDSYIEAGHEMNKRDREQYYAALIEYLYYGVEPKVKGTALAVLTAIRPSLDESRARITNGRKGGRPKNNQACEHEKSQTLKTEKANCEIPEKLNPENEKSQPSKSEKANCEISEKLNTENEKSKTPKIGKPNSKGNSKGNSKEELSYESSKKVRPRFTKPTVEEVLTYAQTRGVPHFDAERFIDYYESNGWKVGKSPMRDWKATVRNWIRSAQPEIPPAKISEGYHAEYD